MYIRVLYHLTIHITAIFDQLKLSFVSLIGCYTYITKTKVIGCWSGLVLIQIHLGCRVNIFIPWRPTVAPFTTTIGYSKYQCGSLIKYSKKSGFNCLKFSINKETSPSFKLKAYSEVCIEFCTWLQLSLKV